MSVRGANSGEAFYGRWIVAACFVFCFLFAGAGFYSFSIFIRPLEDAFGWSRSSISLAMSLYMLVSGLAGPLVGRATETYGPKRVMTVFSLLAGASFILVSFSSSLWFFYLSYVLLAVGTAGIGFIPVSSVLARWYVRRRGTAIGVSMLGISVGGLLLAPLVGWIITAFGWRSAFVFLGVLVWALGLPVAIFVIKGAPREMGMAPDGDIPEAGAVAAGMEGAASGSVMEQGWPLRAALRSRRFFWINLSFFLAPLAQMGMLQHQVPIIVEAGVAESFAAAGLGLTAGLGGLGKLWFGRISELLPFRYVVVLCFGLQALAVAVLLAAQNAAMVWAYIALFGFSMGGVIVLVPLVVAHFFGLTAFGVIMGVVSLVVALGDAGGALASGMVYDALGGYRYAMVAYIVLYLMAVAAILLAGEPEPYRGGRRSDAAGR